MTLSGTVVSPAAAETSVGQAHGPDDHETFLEALP